MDNTLGCELDAFIDERLNSSLESLGKKDDEYQRLLCLPRPFSNGVRLCAKQSQRTSCSPSASGWSGLD